MELEKVKNELAELQAVVDAREAVEKAKTQRLAELQAAIDAEEKRLNSKEYKDARKAINEMAVEAEARKKTIHELVDSTVAEFDEWVEIAEKCKALARENRIETPDLMMAEMRIGGNIFQLREAIREWKQKIAWRETFSNMYKPTRKKR